MTTHPFNFDVIDSSWDKSLKQGLMRMPQEYLEHLKHSTHWLPGSDHIFRALSLPMSKVNYVLLGESPYPRKESANGYAFWDAAVHSLWSPTGLDKKVNRATSFRNIIKMLLVAEGLLSPKDVSQEAIAAIDKSHLVSTNQDFFTNLLSKGFLLLNATLVLQDQNPQKDARVWLPCLQQLFHDLLKKNPHIKFILLGRIANFIDTIVGQLKVDKIYAEHPYNHTFITNQNIRDFFQPLHLLRKNPQSM